MTDNPNASAWKDPTIWGRVVFALLYMLILALVVGPLVIMLGLVQGAFMIATGEDNRNLRGLGAALAEYVHEMLLFATWNREQKPFPFSEFPRVDSEAAGEAAGPVEDETAETQARDAVSAGEQGESGAAVDSASESGDAEEEASTAAAATGKPARKSARRKKSGSGKASADDSASED